MSLVKIYLRIWDFLINILAINNNKKCDINKECSRCLSSYEAGYEDIQLCSNINCIVLTKYKEDELHYHLYLVQLMELR